MKTNLKTNGKNLTRILSLVCMVFVSLIPNYLKASDERSINSSNVTAGSSFWVYDAKYSDMNFNPSSWQTTYTNKKVTNIVRLSALPGLTEDFEVKVNVTIESWKWNATTLSFNASTVTTNLQIAGSTNGIAVINDKQAVVLQDALALKVTINSVNFLSGTTAISNLNLTSEIITDRQYFINATAVNGLGHSPSAPALVLAASELDLSWDYKPGAEWYELEYVHIDKWGPEDKPMGVNDLSFNYYMNSTRVEVKGNHYVIPKIYDRGYVIYRVRAIGFNGATYSSRFESDWTAPESGNLSTHPAANIILIENDYDPFMNWTFSASFAEEGKRSEAIVYQDGIGRGRQVISSNPATRQVIVNNTYYDEMGRPAVVDLPTPVDQTVMNYLPNFNRANDGLNTSFNYTVFDASSVECAVVPNAFSTSYGAGKYYSTNNPDKDGANAGIPDAEGFPYYRTTYKNDLLNRVDKQGAAGAILKTHGGKETRYMDLTSDQLELNMLFGSDIGYDDHYQKTAVIDENGQAMVSYTDMAGRTVASYLTGPAPSSLDALPGNTPSTVTKPLITNGVGGSEGMVSPNMTHTELITESGNYTFRYYFTPEEYSKVCNGNSICLDCVYDFNFKIVDDCGTVFLDHTEQIGGEELDAECTPGNFTMSPITAYLYGNHAGINGVVYTITKSLSVNMDVIDDYWCYNLDASCIDVPDIFNELYDDATFTDCTPNVETSLGDGPCAVYAAIMLQDMSPGGQYADYTLIGSTYSYTDPLSILNLSSSGSKYNSVTYLDQSGAPITVQNNAGVFVSPATLTPEEFIQKFQDEWAWSLLQLHPEYCYYDDCITANTAASIAYDEAMLNTNSFTAAFTAGYFTPVPGGTVTTVNTGGVFNTVPGSAPTDPFFTGPYAALASGMNTLMADYIVINGVHYSMWDYAIILGMPCTDGDYLDCLTNANKEGNCSLDYIWAEFRRMYLEAKKNLINENTSKKCPDNCTIGVSGTYATKVRVFPCWSELSANNPTPLTTELQDEIDSLCNETCSDFADEWLAKLSGCNISSGDLPGIRQDLIDLCKSGCSVTNPQGFSTDMSGNGIQSVLAAHGIAETDLCTELLIADPGPYQSFESEQNEAYPSLDVCGCDAVMQAREDLEAYLATNPSPALFTTVEQMLAHNTGIIIDELDPILCACDKVKAENDKDWSENSERVQLALSQYGYHIPAALSCDDGNCPDCATVQASMSALQDRFDGITLSDSPNYATIVTNYLNGVYNQDYSYFQYLEFFSKCNASTESPFCTQNPATPELLNMLTLLAYRGQLTSTTPIDLQTNNAVYQFGQIRNFLPYPGLVDYTYDVSGNLVKMSFSHAGEKCMIHIDNTIGIDFNAILSFDMIANDSPGCSESATYSLVVTYLDCGQLITATLPITSDCFDFYNCVCDPSTITLCDVSDPIPNKYCYSETLNQLYHTTINTYNAQVEEAYAEFVQEYALKCSQAFSTENMEYDGYQNNYQYTLFYYDQAGNLVKTVAPEGVVQLLESQNDDVNYARDFGNTSIMAPPVRPVQTFETKYAYNSYNQVVSTTNPDQNGATVLFYDFYGRIAASQNPEQALINQYSYVLYDAKGRPVESGQVNRSVPGSGMIPVLDNSFFNADDLDDAFRDWVYSGMRSEVNITTYDTPLSTAIASRFKSGTQQNLRLRVATVAYYETVPKPVTLTFFRTMYTSAIHYSYDIHGNVIEQLQDVPELAPVQQDVKSTQYDFELISGNVNAITYQAGEADQFVHTYTYDVVNRLTETSTSPDKYTYSREARYLYYDYGPLARKELGEQKVQAEDYAYTINGWLKLKNGTVLNPLNDAGKDGRTGYETANPSGHLNIPADVTGYTLGYFEGDYKPIGGGMLEAVTAGTAFGTSASNLYNGNIRLSTTAIQNIQESTTTPGTYINEVIGASYHYDQLNRLKSMRAYFSTGLDNATTNSWSTATTTNAYSSAITYDRNGNIKTLKRYADSPSSMMDNMTYNPVSMTSNQLSYVTETAGVATYDDISNTQSSGNYVYDRLGQLSQDISEGITNQWRYGDKKLRQMTKGSDVTAFLYDPFGRRIAKINKPGGTTNKALWSYSYYANEANGQVMSVYEIKYSTNDVFQKELHLYGADRLGMAQFRKLVYNHGVALPTDNYSTNTLGNKRYELTNHLGNVNAVITDRKVLNSGYSALSYYFDFASTGHTGWTTTGCSGTTIALASGRLRFTSGSSCAFDAYKSFQVSPGRPYTISFDLDRTDIGNMNVLIYTASGPSFTGASLITTITNPASGAISYSFTPTQQYVFVYFKKISTENKTFYTDNLKIQTVATSPYAAVTVMTSDYYPFGMQMPRRHTDDNYYRFGYNGMEKDAEMHGEGNSYTTEFRQYDPRLGRWLSLDPLMMQFPWMSPYAAFDNNPVVYVDPYGLQSGNGIEGDPPGLPKTTSDGNGGQRAWKRGDQFLTEDGDLYTHNGAKENPWEMKVTAIEEVTIIRNSTATEKLIHLNLVSGRGTADAIANAMSLGMYDAFGGNHVDEYNNVEDKIAYLRGRIAGDIAAGAIGVNMIEGGLTVAVVTSETGVGAIAGGVTALVGSGEVYVATEDAIASATMIRHLSTASNDIEEAGETSSGGGKKDLPSLDGTGKLHGELPSRKQWMKHSREELIHLLHELKKSVKQRSYVNSTHPNKDKLPGHTRRLNQELDLIRDIEHYLYGK